MSTPNTKCILLWSPRGAGTHYNGPGSFAYRLYQQEALASHQITLAHQNSDQPKAIPLFDQTINVGNAGSAVGRLNKSGTWAAKNTKNYDVLHGLGGFHPTVYPAWRAARAELPVVLFPMLSGVEFSHTKGVGGLLRLPAQRRAMIRSFAGFVAMSASIENELLGCGVEPSKIARIPMGIDGNRFTPSSAPKDQLRSKLGLRNVPTVVFCGSLTRRKRPHLILEAIKIVARQFEVQTVFVGPTVDEEYTIELKEAASQLPQSAHCVFTGHTTEPERFMQAADVYCLPSSSEGQPASVLEAMACGLAVVVTQLPGLDTYIEEESAGFYSTDQANDIAKQLIKAYETTEDQRQNARTKIEERCSLSSVATAHNHLFDLVISGKSPNTASLDT